MATAARPLRLGILGAARIARNFIAGVSGSERVAVTAVAARDVVRAQAFARETGVERVFDSYEALLADGDVDAVYVPLPNGLHAEWSIKAAAAGKHVICEKPLALNEAQARRMYDAARRNKVRLVEAYPYLSQPQTRKARDIVRSGALGSLKLIRTAFGAPIGDITDIRYDAALGGGALMDIGSYSVSMMRVMAGERPLRVQAIADWAETGVDRSAIALVTFKSGLLAQVSASFTGSYHRHAQIVGEKGSLDTAYQNHPPMGGPPVLHWRKGPTVAAEVETVTVEGGNGFLAEAESFARMISDGPEHWNGISEQESLDVAATIDAMILSAHGNVPVELAAQDT
jgi:predicted dehydrogenase